MRKVVILLALGLSASLQAAQCRLSRSDENAVTKLPQLYRDAWYSDDAEKSVMNLFVDSAAILPHHGVAPKNGAEAIRAFWFPKSTRPFDLLEFTMTPEAIDGCGEVAYVHGKQTLRWKFRDDPAVTSQRGTFLMIARKVGKEWRVHRFMWDDAPNEVQ
jgi:ketosteroid isomerase-like protein